MKTKKLGLITAIALAMIFLFALNASAAWFTCTVTMAGPGGSSNIYIRLTDNAGTPAFVDRWFLANAQQKNEILATALTALTNNMAVTVNLSSTAQYSIINNLYLCP
jgi:hypothetical protein